MTKRKSLVLILFFAMSGNTQIMTEENTTLRTMASYMHVFYKENHRYAKSWTELGIKPFCFNNNTPPIRANLSQHKVFKPNGCRYTYVLISNGNNLFKIRRYINGKFVDFVDQNSDVYVP